MRFILEPWTEVVGVIKSIEKSAVIFHGIGDIYIKDPILLSKLRGYIGKKISVLRTDLNEKPYLIKNVEVKQ